MGVAERGVALYGLVAGLLQRHRDSPQGMPPVELRKQIRARRSSFRSDRGRGCGSVLGFFVPFQLALDAAQRISARTGQVFSSIVQFILIEIELSLGQINLLLCSVLMHAAGGGKLLLHLIEPILIGLHVYFRLSYVSIKFASLGRGRGGMVRSVAQRVFEGKVNFVIGKTQRLIRESLLVPIGSRLGDGASGQQRSFVHQRRLPRMRIL